MKRPNDNKEEEGYIRAEEDDQCTIPDQPEKRESNGSYLKKMMKKNDGNAAEANLKIQRVPSASHKRFQVIEFDDALVLKILISENGEELRAFCTDRNMSYRLRRDKKPAFIEMFGADSNEMAIGDVEEFGQLVLRYKQRITRDIASNSIRCNQEEYNHIKKELDDYIDVLNSTEMKFIDPEGNQDEANPELTYDPELIKSYQVNQRFIIKIMKIEKPGLLGFSTIDLFLLNIDPDSILTDSYGYELVQKNSLIKSLIKKNADKIASEDMVYDLMFAYENKDVNLCLQTSKTQERCLENLRQLLAKLDKQELQSKGFLNLGISLNQACNKKYLAELLRYLSKLADEDDSYLAFPSEIQIFIPQDKEANTLSYFSDVIKNKTINPEKVRKGGSWGYAIQYYGNANNNNMFNYQNTNFSNNVNIMTTPFKELASVAIEKAFLKEEKKTYIATTALIQPNNVQAYGYYRKGRKVNVRNEEVDDDMIEEVQVDFEKMTETLITSGIERPISQDPKKKSLWCYVDTITQEFVPFEEEICKVFKYCVDQGQTNFHYQRNLIDFTLASKIMKCDFTLSSMIDLNSGDIFAIKREENQKYNYLVEEVDPNLKTEKINMMEQKREKPKKQEQAEPNKMEEEEKNIGPHLRVRGLKENLELVTDIFETMKKQKFTTHVIQIGKKLAKGNLKYLNEIAKQNNLELNYDEKTEEISIKGYKKTINRIRSQLIQSLSIQFDEFRVPDDWEQQDEEVEIFECKLDTEYSKHISKLVKKSLPNARIHKIQRIQNLKLWKNFLFEKKKLEDKGDASEKWLFHGTRNTDPSVIYKGSEEGFDFRVCGGGMYGRGTYFHDLASYSYGFGHNKGGKVQLFCAKVLIGKCYATAPNGQLTAPPFIPGSKSIRYDSIRSNNQIGSNEYVIFNNSKAYPYYLITLVNNGGNNVFGGGINFMGAKVPQYYGDDDEEEEEEDLDYDNDEFDDED